LGQLFRVVDRVDPVPFIWYLISPVLDIKPIKDRIATLGGKLDALRGHL
jgi:hypothetical protein